MDRLVDKVHFIVRFIFSFKPLLFVSGDSEIEETGPKNLRPPSDSEEEYYLSDEVSDIEEIDDDSVVGIDSESDDVQQILDSEEEDVESIGSSDDEVVEDVDEYEKAAVVNISSSSEKEKKLDEHDESEESEESSDTESEILPVSSLINQQKKDVNPQKEVSLEKEVITEKQNINTPNESTSTEALSAESNLPDSTVTETIDSQLNEGKEIPEKKPKTPPAAETFSSYEDTINEVAKMNDAQLAEITARIAEGGTPEPKKKRVRKKKPVSEDVIGESSDGATPVKDRKKKSKDVSLFMLFKISFI